MSLQLNDENCRNDITAESCDFLLTPQQSTGRPSILRPSQKENLPPKNAVKAMKVTFQTPMKDPQTQRILSPNIASKQEDAFTLDDCAAALENLHIDVFSSSECILLSESVIMSQEHDGQTTPYLNDLVRSRVADCTDCNSVDKLNPSNISPKMENSPKILFSHNMDVPEKDPSYLQVDDALCLESTETIPLKDHANSLVENNCPSMEIVDLSTEIKPVINDLFELITKSTCNTDIVSMDPSTAATKVLESPSASKGCYKFDPDQIDLIDPFKPRESKLQNSPAGISKFLDSGPEASNESVTLKIDTSDGNTIRKPSPKSLGKRPPGINDGSKTPPVVKKKVEKVVNEEEMSEDIHAPKASCTIEGDRCDSNLNSFTSEVSKIPNVTKLPKPSTEDISIRHEGDMLPKKPESVLGSLVEEKPVVCDNIGKQDPLSLCSNSELEDQRHDAGCCAPYPDDELPVKSQGTYNMDFNSLEDLNLSEAYTKLETSSSTGLFSPIMNIPTKEGQSNLLDVCSVAAAERIPFNSANSMAEDDCSHGRAVGLSKPAINELSDLVTKSSCNEITSMDPSAAARKILESPLASKASYNFGPNQIDLFDPFKTGGSKLQNSPVGVSQCFKTGPEASKAESVKLEFEFTDGNTVIRKPPLKRLGKRPPVMKNGAKKPAVIQENGGGSKTSSSPKLQKSSTGDLIGKESDNPLLKQNVFVPETVATLDQPDTSGSLKCVESLNQGIRGSAVKGTYVAISEGQVAKEPNMAVEHRQRCILLSESVIMSQEHDGQTTPYLNDLVRSRVADCTDCNSVDKLNPSNISPKMENSPKILFSHNMDVPEKDPSYLQVDDALCLESTETIPLKDHANSLVENSCPSMEIVDLSTEIKPVINDLFELITKSTCNTDIVSMDPSTAATKVLESPSASKGCYKFDPDQIDLIDPFKPRESKLQNSPAGISKFLDSGPEASNESVTLKIDTSDGNTIRKPSPKSLGKRPPGINDGSKTPPVVKKKVEKVVNERKCGYPPAHCDSGCSNSELEDQRHDAGCCAPYPDDELPVKSQGTYNMDFNSLEDLNLSEAYTKLETSSSTGLFSPIMNIPTKEGQSNLLDVCSVAAAERIPFNSANSMAEDDCSHGRAVGLSKPAINELSDLVTKSSCNEITSMDPSAAARKILESPLASKASYNFGPNQIDLFDPFKTGGSKLQNSPVGVSQCFKTGPEASKAESVKLEFEFTDGNTVIRKPPLKRLGKRPPVMKNGAKKPAVIQENGGGSKTSSSPKLQKSSTGDLIGKESDNPLLKQNVFVPETVATLDQPDTSGSLKCVESLNQGIRGSAVKGTYVAISEGQVAKEPNMGQELNPLDLSSSRGNLTSVSDRKAVEDELDEHKAAVKPGSYADISIFEMDFKPAAEFEGLCQPIEIDYLEQFGSSSFKESALRKQSLYLKFDPLLRESPRKTHTGVQETNICLTNVSLKSCSGPLESEIENTVHVEPFQNEEKPKGLDLLGTFTISEPSTLVADISTSPRLSTSVLPFPTVDAIVEVLKFSQKDMDAAIEAVQLKVQEKELDVLHWKNKHERLLIAYTEMGKIVAEFECTVTQMIEDSQKQKEDAKLEIQKILQEKQHVQDDLNSMEKSFSELFKRFEKQKDVLEGYRKNEEALKKCVEDYVARISKEEQRYQALKAHAEEKLKRASEEIAQVRSKAKGEIAALQASLRKEQMKIKSMEQCLEQKAKENDELTKICDDLISKMERSS
ncbi:transforming acidic coiled-coil-containing protein 3 [Microcaecilia unicolor]|uniref:Transforming acidic coiled-coil-containing protein 3 n=1 Tax=Microcaecilia unicolor TaxID=1415580 RepID=A0A6P7XD04_9AMPH|nr:transforming acidic coiled-coil-containing protein 3 [Microcaecilia unicolor]